MAKKSKPKITEEEKESLEVAELLELEEIETLDDDDINTKEILENIPEEINEVKHNTFLRLAKPRTQKVLNSLKILGNCSNKSSYAYTIYEVDLMFDTIQIALNETKAKFSEKLIEQKALFDF